MLAFNSWASSAEQFWRLNFHSKKEVVGGSTSKAGVTKKQKGFQCSQRRGGCEKIDLMPVLGPAGKRTGSFHLVCWEVWLPRRGDHGEKPGECMEDEGPAEPSLPAIPAKAPGMWVTLSRASPATSWIPHRNHIHCHVKLKSCQAELCLNSQSSKLWDIIQWSLF